MKTLYHTIDNQINQNKGINLFWNKEIPLTFADKSIMALKDIRHLNTSEIQALIDYTVDNVTKEFYRVNQYYNFDTQSKDKLKTVYKTLVHNIRNEQLSDSEILSIHHKNLSTWLRNTHPHSERMYSKQGKMLDAVACFEYDPSLQLDILEIDLNNLIQPVLDIGCGENAFLVKFLREKGIEAYGIDRYEPHYKFIKRADWLEYNYGKDKWGTIISNLGFSNHFVHHHLRKDGNYIVYARKYMEIIQSIKRLGSFHYAPTLPFIEQYMDTDAYIIKHKELKDSSYSSTTLIRIK
ncbi:MAG: class I SAM-dependent methyltransferase [Dysgonomonas sp.]|nr:class I SAM-dependent methyltransferase [Dysgonomonas sp.]